MLWRRDRGFCKTDLTIWNCSDRNCNTYADALCQLLLGKPVPAYVNRAAYLGSFLSCLMPADVMEQAPVGDSTTRSRITNATSRRSDTVYTPFAGALLLCLFLFESQRKLNRMWHLTSGSGQSLGGAEEASLSELSTRADQRKRVRLAALRRMGVQEQ